MLSERWKSAVAVLFAGIVMSGTCFGYSDEGFQWWTSTGVSMKINEGWKCTFAQELRLGDDGGNLYHEHSDLGFTYSGLADWIDVGANFRVIYEKDGHDEWRRENRPHLNVTLKGRLFDTAVSNRVRVEYRDRENKDDVWRCRNKVTAKLPFELTALKLKPYVAEEIFVTMNNDNIDRNRLYTGASFDLSEGLAVNIYYMWQASRSGHEWKDIQVLGTALKFAF